MVYNFQPVEVQLTAVNGLQFPIKFNNQNAHKSFFNLTINSAFQPQSNSVKIVLKFFLQFGQLPQSTMRSNPSQPCDQHQSKCPENFNQGLLQFDLPRQSQIQSNHKQIVQSNTDQSSPKHKVNAGQNRIFSPPSHVWMSPCSFQIKSNLLM